MTKNIIYNVIISLCLTSGIYNLSACVFNPMGTTLGNVTTSDSNESNSISPTSTSEVNQSSTTILYPTTSSNTSIDHTTTTTESIDNTSDNTSLNTSNITDVSSSTLNSSSTTFQNECGNNILEINEECDGPDLGENSCTTLGLPENNMLFCNRDCTFNTTKCGNCGNCILDSDEECDPCLFEPTSGAYCETEETDFGKCVLKFTKPILYAHTSLDNDQMMTYALDKEEADVLCKIYNRDLNSVAISWNQNIKGWPKSYNYFYHFTLGLPEAVPLISTNEILNNYKFYYIDSKYLNPNLDPSKMQFQFMCE